MSLVTTILYDTSSDFTFDSSQIQFNGSNASLKLVSNSGQVFSQPFTSSSGFTFSSSATEFTGGLMRQVDTRPANESFYASYASSINANWSTGSGTGTASGSATIVGGQLFCNNGFVTYDGVGNADSLQVGCYRFRVIPQYSGTPSDRQLFVWTSSLNSGSINDALYVYHDTDGSLYIEAFDSAGSLIFVQGTAWSPTSGTQYEIELDYDLTGGVTQLFIDGVQLGATQTGTGTRAAVNFIYVGEQPAQAFVSNFKMTGLEFFSIVQHTGNYTAPSPLPNSTIYITDTISIPNFVYSGAGHVLSYSAAAATDTNAPHYTINGKYWDGAAWSASNGSYTQSNIISTISAHIGALAASDTTSAQVIWQSSNTPMSVDLLTVTYTGQNYPTGNPSVMVNSGILTDGLDSFSAVDSASGSDSVLFILNVSGQDKYFNGTAWVNSDGSLAQANTAVSVNTNAVTLDLTSGFTVKLKALLHSASGATTPSITSATIHYSFFVPPPSPPNRCIGYLNLLDVIGDIGSLDQAVLVVDLQKSFKYGSIIVAPFRRTFAFNQSGYVETTALYLSPQDASASDGLVETQSLSLSPYRIGVQYQNGAGELITALTTSNIQIPNQFSVDLSTLLVTG